MDRPVLSGCSSRIGRPMLQRLKRFDRLISESEARVAEHRTLIAAAEAEGNSTMTAERALAGLEAVLVEYRRGRDATEDLRQMLSAKRERRPWRRQPSE